MRFKIVSLDFSINDTLVSFIKEKSEVKEVERLDDGFEFGRFSY